MKCDPTDAAPPFNLGNMLRASGRKVEAEAALRAATRADPTFAEAWYNLSDLLDEQGRSEAAIDCLRRALQADPGYADAMFNLALLLQRNNKHAEAVEYWRRYLANDAQSEWAARARRSYGPGMKASPTQRRRTTAPRFRSCHSRRRPARRVGAGKDRLIYSIDATVLAK